MIRSKKTFIALGIISVIVIYFSLSLIYPIFPHIVKEDHTSFHTSSGGPCHLYGGISLADEFSDEHCIENKYNIYTIHFDTILVRPFITTKVMDFDSQ